ncbi:MAG TPA: magnesium-translocating P-type ATPase [Terriglobales bacterium]|nr:magnesium-translocating P-type ATPase [Terriglobales bacterium]
MSQKLDSFWSIPSEKLLGELRTGPQGLSTGEAESRLKDYGANLMKPRKRSDALPLFLSQFKSPIILILIFAAGLSFFLHDRASSSIILIIVFLSGILGFWQEKGAVDAVEKLLSIVQVKAEVLRDGKPVEIPVEEIVPGDIVILNAGDIIPGDCLILESKDLFIDEAALTGETYPVDKSPGVLPEKTPLAQRDNSLFMGTHVVSGTARTLVVRTGKETEFGKVSERLRLRAPETEFERGVKRFGYFLLEITLILVILIFAFNVYLSRPVLESLLFSLALAVGLTPQLLPAIISVNLSHGAKRMAEQKVIVKKLDSIENFGSMNVLCSDKTGTLTEGVVRLHSALDVSGNESEKVLLFAYLNSFYETGFTNPIDEAIRANRKFDLSSYQKLDEEPYDFVRKRLSILVSKDQKKLMVTKGALSNILDVCSFAEEPDGNIVNIEEKREEIKQRFEDFSSKGYRLLGISYRDLGSETSMTKESESQMIFLGFLVLHDPAKPGLTESLNRLKETGISLKVITGDNRAVAGTLCTQVGLPCDQILCGSDIHQMSDEALVKKVNEVEVFAEVEPNHKERIILALRKAGNVVGFMGDGINDASALHSADVGISVDTAVDVAKEAADIVLLEKDLGVLAQGVQEGRKTFANTLKYVFMSTSANFGNMFSMAGASLFLPFVPLLPTQILLTNLLTDFPEMTIATDSVDKELVEKPRRWDVRFIRNFMLTFGPVSSVFDYLTFGVLLLLLHASKSQFRTGWFLESVISASLVVLVIRTRRPFFKSRPGKYLFVTTILVVLFTLFLPFTPLGKLFQFSPLRADFLLIMGLIVLFYILGAEFVKSAFYVKRGRIPESLAGRT